jgi:hypothetical protein
LKIIKYNYSRAECYREMIEWINNIYKRCEKELFLSDINLFLIKEIAGFLGIKTKICLSSKYIIEGDKSDKIMNICIQSGANEYLSGPAAKSYLNLAAFDKEGINVKWMNYSDYREYLQLYPPFIHGVSIIDVILNKGVDTINYLNSFKGCIFQESFPLNKK